MPALNRLFFSFAPKGTVMELMLTHPEEKFKSFLKGHNEIQLQGKRDAFHFIQAGDMVLRSQLDCQHPDLPKKVFDLKSRATIPIRLDVENYKVLHTFSPSPFLAYNGLCSLILILLLTLLFLFSLFLCFVTKSRTTLDTR